MISARKKRFFIGAILTVFILMFLYRYSPYKFQFLGHYDKIWAHRVNSLPKLESALSYFDGIELDLMYDAENDVLDVNHPPAASIGLNFETYLKTVANSGKAPKIWLDVKNLNQEYEVAIFRKLTHLFESHNYNSHNVLIESVHPETLKQFSDYGFQVSYYLPQGLHQKNTADLDDEIYKIQRVIDENPKMAISTDYKDYDILKTHFPNKDKCIWALVGTFNPEFSKLRDMLKDSTVKVVLVNYKAISGNR